MRWPIEVLWERPKRRAAAQLALDATASSLVQSGLDLALAVRLSHADYALAIDRQRLATETAAALERIDTLTQSRLAAGDIGALEARVARVDAARGRQDADRAAHDVRLARERLRLLMGLAADDPVVDRIQASPAPDTCGAAADLLPRALAARPDVRAAEIAVEAAAARLGWERVAVFCIHRGPRRQRQGTQGFEAGPGIDVGLADLQPEPGRAPAGRRPSCSAPRRPTWPSSSRSASTCGRRSTLLDQARESRTAWRTTLVTPLEANLADAEDAYRAGDSSFLFVLENSRRLIEARLRERETRRRRSARAGSHRTRHRREVRAPAGGTR